MIAGGFTCQRYGFNVGADKFSLLTIENGKNKHYAPIGMDIDFPKPKISLRQAARDILHLLIRNGIISQAKGKEGPIYKPERAYTHRMRLMMDQLLLSKDPIWLEVCKFTPKKKIKNQPR